MRARIANHARDHRPGGADPIAGTHLYPVTHFMDPWMAPENTNEVSNYASVTDFAATVRGAYMESTANGAYMIWPMRLGPYGSVWSVFITVHKGTDFGIIDYQFSTADDNEYGAGRYTVNADASWVTHASRDCYNAVSQKNQRFFEHAFRIKGKDGAALTDISGTDPDVAGAYVFDGGAGLYLFRLHVNGKNGLSSSYRTQVATVEVKRVAT